MKKGFEIIGFWILWTIVLFICITCLFGMSLLDGFWVYLSTLGAASSAFCLSLLLSDKNKPDYYDR